MAFMLGKLTEGLFRGASDMLGLLKARDEYDDWKKEREKNQQGSDDITQALALGRGADNGQLPPVQMVGGDTGSGASGYTPPKLTKTAPIQVETLPPPAGMENKPTARPSQALAPAVTGVSPEPSAAEEANAAPNPEPAYLPPDQAAGGAAGGGALSPGNGWWPNTMQALATALPLAVQSTLAGKGGK